MKRLLRILFSLAVYVALVCGACAQGMGMSFGPGPGMAHSAGGTPFAVDGTPVGATGTASSFALPGLTTTYGNDLIYVVIESNGGPITGVSDTAGNTYTARATQANLFTYSAKAGATPMSGNVITINSTSSSFYNAWAFAISNIHTAAPFDPNAAIPAVHNNSGQVTYTTSNANDLLIAANTTATSTTFPNVITSTNFLTIAWTVVSATQAGSTPGWGIGADQIADAVIQGP